MRPCPLRRGSSPTVKEGSATKGKRQKAKGKRAKRMEIGNLGLSGKGLGRSSAFCPLPFSFFLPWARHPRPMSLPTEQCVGSHSVSKLHHVHIRILKGRLAAFLPRQEYRVRGPPVEEIRETIRAFTREKVVVAVGFGF